MHLMQYKLVISENMIIATCHNTSIRFLEIFNVDKKVRWLSDRVHVSLITRCELSRILPYDTLVDIYK